MARFGLFLALLMLPSFSVFGQGTGTSAGDFRLALPDHSGQLHWTADGFKITQSSAKPNRHEIGIRAKDESGRLTFLGFLFLIPEQAPLSSAKCRDGAMESEKKGNSTLKILATADNVRPGASSVSVVSYSAGKTGKEVYSVRAFTATGDMCGDLEFYSNSPIAADDADLKKVFASYQLDERYIPNFRDALLYAQILYDARIYKAAAPIFEIALAKVNEDPGPDGKTMRRVITDQAGMAYGMSGDLARARSIFEKAISGDPDYPMYYYNLACADAEEKNLAGARANLQKAFDRKANVISGEKMPDPTSDDSFTPYRNDREFWAFLQGLRDR